MKRIHILKVGDSFPSLALRRGDFEDWIIEKMGVNEKNVHIAHVLKGEAFPHPREIAAAIITGSHAMVTDNEPWSLKTERWVQDAAKEGIPMLGICYGHQLIARGFGGTPDYNPNGPEFGSVELRLTGTAAHDPLFEGLPQKMMGFVSHFQSVTVAPPGAAVLAESDKDPHQAFRIEDRIWGVQFHPEYDMDIIRSYIEESAEDLRKAGASPEELIEQLDESPYSAKVLQRFYEWVQNH